VLSRTLGNGRWLGEIHKYRGVILRRMARPELAEAALSRALDEARRREELLLVAEIRKELARLFGEQGRHREMFSCLTDAHGAFAQLRARRDLEDVTREIETLERSFERIVHEWSDSIESADHYTHGHCERVADHACGLAVAAGIDARYLTWFRMGALLHDVGKVSVPAAILNKPGALDDAEWQIMKQHPEQGVRLLAGIEFPWDVRAMVLHHHEHWDGGGYPDGLRGPEIPLAARVLCVADVYDALTTTRSYRAGFAPAVALEIMAGDAGHIFDPELFEAFRALVSDRLVRRRRNDGVHGHGFVRPGRWGTVDRQPPVHAVA
jgi:putative nucleotidyltransferase with HDIG domain